MAFTRQFVGLDRLAPHGRKQAGKNSRNRPDCPKRSPRVASPTRAGELNREHAQAAHRGRETATPTPTHLHTKQTPHNAAQIPTRRHTMSTYELAEAKAAAMIAAARNASAEASAAKEYMTPEQADAVLTFSTFAVEASHAAARAAGFNPDTLVYWASGSHEWRAYNVTDADAATDVYYL